MKTVLVLDSDVGFVFWCGHVLTEAGYLPLAALSVPEAVKLLARVNLKVDALIVNPTVRGADDFVGHLRDTQAHARVIAALEVTAERRHLKLCVEAVRAKPLIADERAAQGWLTTMNFVLGDRTLPP